MTRSATLLFAAHDIGGGRVLASIAQACRAAGYRIATLAQGPAREVLAIDGATILPQPHDHDGFARALHDLRPAAAVTGTSVTATLDREVWDVTRRLGVPSVAIIDAPVNLAKRFHPPAGGMFEPDVICVVDEGSRRQLKTVEGLSARIVVVGQPHLERVGEMVRSRRRLSNSEIRFVYYSEPLSESPSEVHAVGYDQFTVLERLLPGLAEIAPVSLVLKPHPGESTRRWEKWLGRARAPKGVRLSVDAGDSIDLMAGAHGVIGLASMALIEAACAGIPALALQPDRRYCPSPLIDASPSIRVITDPSSLIESTRNFARDAIATAGTENPAAYPFIGSTERVMKVIYEVIGAGIAARRGEKMTGAGR